MKNKKINTLNTNFYINPVIDKLDNELEIVVDKKDDANTFSLCFLIKSGSSTDIKEKLGLAHLVEHLLFRNTQIREGGILANKFEDLGAFVNAFTTKEYTVYYVKGLNEYFSDCLELLFELVFLPDFREKDLEKEKMIIKEEILSYEDDPEESIIDYAEEILYQYHPLSNSILGTSDTIDNININDVIDYHNRNYFAGNTILSYSGNLSHSDLIGHLKKYKFNGKSFSKQNIRFDISYSNKKTITIDKNYTQSQILKFLRFKTENTKELLMTELFNISFGEGISSRLYQNIREKQGLTYNIYSGINNYRYWNTFYIYTATDNNNIKNVSELINEEIKLVYENGLSEVELNRAKKLFKTNLILEIEDIESRMLNNARNLSVNKEEVNVEVKLQTLESIQLEEINKYIQAMTELDKFTELIFI